MRTLFCAIIGVTALENYCAASAPFADEQLHPSIFTAQEYVSHIGTEWPKHYGLILTEQISTCLASSGQFGDGFGYYGYSIPSDVGYSFETPAGSGHEYLFGGGLWIGGIINGDTLVSVATDGWLQMQEFYPSGFRPGNLSGTVFPISSCAPTALRSACDDTIHTGMNYLPDAIDPRPHIPLGIKVAQRAYSWSSGRESYCALFDLVISNIGNDTIHQGYVGFYFDADIGATMGYFDDLAGGIQGQGIGYVVDNDGELPFPDEGIFDRSFSFKFIRSSIPVRDTNFNWWVSNGNPVYDYGPMKKVNYRDFGTGARGTPEGDRNKYHLLSKREWDFDQVMTSTIRPDDPIWVYPADTLLVRNLSNGWDTRFLMSVGPFELPPDSSVRLQCALITADSIHSDIHIMDLIWLAPELYTASLGLDRLSRTGHLADSLATLLLDPMLPPHGLTADHIWDDSSLVSWDFWGYNNIDGYRLYGEVIPKSAFRHEGVPPPWYRTTPAQVFAESTSPEVVLRELNRYSAYSLAVGHVANNEIGQLSDPLQVKLPTPLSAPVTRDSMLFVLDGEPSTITWDHATGGDRRQYNIYRFADSSEARRRYRKHYSEIYDEAAADSVTASGRVYYYYEMPPYASVEPTSNEFTDPEPANGNVYVVTAIDTAGYESDFSEETVVWTVFPPTKDILVLTHSQRIGTYTIEDSIDQFYHRVLTGYRYDIYSVADTLSRCQPVIPACLDWRDFTRYRLVIADDNLRDYVLRGWYENDVGGFTKYLMNGGAIVYCGQFANIGIPEFNGFTQPNWYRKSHPFVSQFFGIDSIFSTGLLYYKNNATAPYQDTILGFSYAEPSTDAPQLCYAADRLLFPSYLTDYWPATTPPAVAAFRADSSVEVIYRFRSVYPSQSRVEGAPVGLLREDDSLLTISLGFHLWYMEEVQARQFVDWVMNKVQIPLDSPEDDDPTLPEMTLRQNYPNPFNPTTTIEFTLPRNEQVKIDIYNIIGQTVRSLVDEHRSAGTHKIIWDGKDQRGNPAATGIYLYRMQTGETSFVKKMILVR
ncbi:MAG: T9SS type A sorting domain-containing protein [candidate division Zixibacteria bacterium]|nr:T9SS type A sorting domain-containing protein [candidate division Zixibacteria bacterium]